MATTNHATVIWQSGMKFSGTADSGHELVMDSAQETGGTNAGFRPMELLLVGMAGCTAMDVISILRKKRLPVVGLELRVSGEKATEYPTKFTHITVEYIVRGNDIPEKAVEDAMHLSETKYCGAMATLRGAAEIVTSYRIEPVAQQTLA